MVVDSENDRLGLVVVVGDENDRLGVVVGGEIEH